MVTRSSLAIDVREACRPHRAGKAQWTYGFVSELLHRNIPLILLTDDGPLPPEWRAHEQKVLRIPGTGLQWHWHALAWLRRRSDVLCVHPTSYIVPALAVGRIACIPIVHDLIAFRGEPHQRRAILIERFTLRRAVRHARHVLTVSDATRQDLLARYAFLSPTGVTAIYAGPHRPHAPKNVSDDQTILSIATLSPRKNQLRLIRPYESLPADLRRSHRLLLVGQRGWQDSEIIAAASKTTGVRWQPYVPDEIYEQLLHTCTLFALPSLYEGFGMQILDALQRGIPVLTTNRGSLAEVAGAAACIVDPESVPSIAAGIEKILRNRDYRNELRRAGPEAAQRYSWARTADLFLSVTERMQ